MSSIEKALDKVVQRIVQAMANSLDSATRPANVLVLAPFGQLLPLLQAQWAATAGDGFAPRFETTRSWARAMAGWGGGPGQFDPSTDDFRFDAALDSLTARSLLERAGLRALQDELVPRLLQAAATLAPLAAAVAPGERMAWLADKAQALAAPYTGSNTGSSSGLSGNMSGSDEGNVLRYEAAIAQIALAWVAASGYATDVLWQQNVLDAPDCLIVLGGFQRDPLAHALTAQRDGASVHLALFDVNVAGPTAHLKSAVSAYRAQDFEQEAQWAAACVLHQLKARELAGEGETSRPVSPPVAPPVAPPIALIATDRSLTRRILAMLESSGITVRDETGWTLSTSRMAASVLAALQAAAWNARSDAVLDWLKNAPAFATPDTAPHIAAMEALLRQSRCNLWRQRVLPGIERSAQTVQAAQTPSVPRQTPGQIQNQDAFAAFDRTVQAQLDALQSPRSLQQWQIDAVTHLRACGQWDALLVDAAGQALIKALHWDDLAQAQLAPWPLLQRRLRLDEYTAWVRQTLESASFMPPSSTAAQVVVLPLPQLLAREFFALVVPGCDEQRLSAAPDPTGPWTPPERLALGLPSREQLAAAQRAAWAHAMGCPRIDVLWRHASAEGEALLPSPLLQNLALTPITATNTSAALPTVSRTLAILPTASPTPRGDRLPVKRLSHSAYADLRRCPYRFFANQQLGLREHNELDAELEKRDFGDWLHEVLKDFHEGAASTSADTAVDTTDPLNATRASTQRDWLDTCAAQVTQRRRFSAAEFLPYQAAWPALRDHYLDWWAQHQGQGARFESAELSQEIGLGTLTLIGRLDRVDSTPPTSDATHDATHDAAEDAHTERPALVIDYKTESPATTDKRLKEPLEDLQLAFYAALLPHDSLRAAYLNVNDRDGTQMYEPADIVATRDTLIEGILDDMQRIAGGATLAALGEGAACDYCAARGLCRKDFWELSA